jgi:hypothetical protein
MRFSKSLRRADRQRPTIDWSDPIARGLIALVIGGVRRNVVQGRAVTLASGSEKPIGGEGWIFNGSTVRYEAQPVRPVGNALSMVTVVRPQGSSWRTAIAYGNEATGQASIRVKANGSNNWALHGWSNDHDSSTPVVNGKRVVVGTTLPPTGNLTMYLDGHGILSATTFAYGGITHAICIGGGPDLAPEGWNGTIELVAVWDRALSAAEHQRLAQDPHAMLAAPRRRCGRAAAAVEGRPTGMRVAQARHVRRIV